MSAPKSGKVWDNPQLLVDLIVGLYEVAENAKLLGPAAQTAVQKHMTDQGHAVTWSAIRYVHGICLSLSCCISRLPVL